jgi:2-oxoglutarate dehydrogenase E1 component
MDLDQFTGVNAGYVLELYERYRRNPEAVDTATRKVFESWVPVDAAAAGTRPSAPANIHVIVGAANLADSIRRYGHLAARLDPLGSTPIGDPTLSPRAHGITEDDLRALPAALVGGSVAESSSNAFEAIEKLRRVYCSTTGFDFAQVFVPEEREWLRHAVESGRFLPPMDPKSADALLDRITQVEVFERFLHRTFPGKTRFSVEGLDMLIPILDEIICGAADQGTRHTMIGMAHRGRLNVLAHVLQKPYAQILAEFKDPVAPTTLRVDQGWMGDVKYHAGARTSAPRGHMHVTMAPNLSRLPGYDTHGTLHIIANNQLGFTATPAESYSTSYASGLARGFKIPIVHVNADDPVACLEAARLAWEYRARFRRDFLIDLVGYRRHGHNEGDEPSFTQPLMYRKVATQPTVRDLFAATLVQQGAIEAGRPEALVQKRFERLEQTLASLKPEEEYVAQVPEPVPPGVAGRTQTGVPLARLREINEALLQPPDGFTFHKKLERGRERRRAVLANPEEPTVDWAAAEELALATVLADGIPVRVTGEDVERGTFSQRHAVFHDVESGKVFVPLQEFAHARASFEIHNSPLTENGTIGFEFGYNIQEPDRLVIWEAQYGDFINGAQVILDQFVTSGRAKWGLQPSLVFLLPHGYEGQGPEHSSARPERFLQAAAGINLRLVNCTTAAQYFHLLRRQAALLRRDPLPLFVLTPKSLLRHPATASRPRELAEGRFLSVIDDAGARERAKTIKRVVLCSGKVYVDLTTSDGRTAASTVAVCRVEQLYPFPNVALREVLDAYPAVRDIAWVQEEPENMGAWEFMRPLLEELIGDRCPLRYIGRARSASPSEGSSAWHHMNQKALIERAFDLGSHAGEPSVVLSKQVGALTGSKQ